MLARTYYRRGLRNWCLIFLSLSLIKLSAFTAVAQQKNKTLTAFTPGDKWPDNNGIPINAHGGGILYYNKTYYWYGEHKVGGDLGNYAQVGFHVYSSKDLYNWKDEGIALKVSEDSSSEIFKGSIMERPKVLFNAKNRQFVMWFHLELYGKGYGNAKSGVAVSDRPTGPFKYFRSYQPNAGSWPINKLAVHDRPIDTAAYGKFCGGPNCMEKHPDSLNILARDLERGQMARDMTLFQDDDGKAYHIFASEENSTLHISQLSDDYLSYSGQWARAFVNRFMEAPVVFKVGEKYYFIGSGCTGWNPNPGRSAVATSIFGPWQELGNPFIGDDSAFSFHSQGTYIIPFPGKKDQFIFMADRWQPKDAIDGRYIWLPLKLENNQPVMVWKERWNLKESLK